MVSPQIEHSKPESGRLAWSLGRLAFASDLSVATLRRYVREAPCPHSASDIESWCSTATRVTFWLTAHWLTVHFLDERSVKKTPGMAAGRIVLLGKKLGTRILCLFLSHHLDVCNRS
jgi:hypothetical protein